MDDQPHRQRHLLGVHLTTQLVVFLLAAFVLTTLTGVAVLHWLERTA